MVGSDSTPPCSPRRNQKTLSWAMRTTYRQKKWFHFRSCGEDPGSWEQLRRCGRESLVEEQAETQGLRWKVCESWRDVVWSEREGCFEAREEAGETGWDQRPPGVPAGGAGGQSL